MNSLVHDADVSLWETANRNLLRYMGVGGSFTSFVPERAEGSWLYDSSGRKVLDFTSGQMSSVLGHAHPDLVEALRDAAGRLDHLFSMMIRSEEHTSELQSLMRISYAVFCLKQKTISMRHI